MNNFDNTPSFDDLLDEMGISANQMNLNESTEGEVPDEPEEPIVEHTDDDDSVDGEEPVQESEDLFSDKDLKADGIDMADVNKRLQTESDDPDDDEDDDDLDDEDLDDDDDDDLGEDLDEIENMSDEDLNTLARGLKDDDLVPDGPEVSLTPDEEIRADDLMQIAGTAALIRGEMNAEERTSLLESVNDLRIGMSEGFFNDGLVLDIRESVDTGADDDEAFTESKMYNKTTVRMSKSARKNQLFEIAVITSARAHNDPDYIRYKKACKLKRLYRAKMRQRYRSEAIKRMKVLFARLRNSKSPIIKSLGKKVD